MKQLIAKQWVAALRSGKYPQGTNALRTIDDEYCCLGVLCDILDKKCWTDGVEDATANYVATFGNTDSFDVLPKAVLDITEIQHTNPRVCIMDEESDITNPMGLAELNDGGYTFKQIANLIEKQWKDI